MMEKLGPVNIRVNGKPTIYGSYADLFSSFQWYTTTEKPKEKLPKRYIINKGATILFWSDNKSDKTIVKRSKGDKYDKRLGFLTAYFQYHSGLSKNKANKYLDSLEEE